MSYATITSFYTYVVVVLRSSSSSSSSCSSNSSCCCSSSGSSSSSSSSSGSGSSRSSNSSRSSSVFLSCHVGVLNNYSSLQHVPLASTPGVRVASVTNYIAISYLSL